MEDRSKKHQNTPKSASHVRVPVEIRTKFDTLAKQKRRVIAIHDKILKLERDIYDLKTEERQIIALGGDDLYYSLIPQ